MYHKLALLISTLFLLQPFTFVSFLLCLSENSSELMLFVNLNRHEIKFLVSCILSRHLEALISYRAVYIPSLIAKAMR